MADSEYKLIPLEKTQSIPVNWKFSQEQYDKLVKGHRSNWCVFLRDDVVHVCRVGGEEFYRFKINKIGSNTYVVISLETYVLDDFRSAQIKHGFSETQIEHSEDAFFSLAQDEVEGLLVSYFEINVNRT